MYCFNGSLYVQVFSPLDTITSPTDPRGSRRNLPERSQAMSNEFAGDGLVLGSL